MFYEKLYKMFRIHFFEKLSLVLILICNTFHGESVTNTTEKNLEDESICELSKKQIQEAMFYSSNSSAVKAILVDPKCMDGGLNVSQDQCLAEQYKLIECLEKECFLTKEKLNEEMEGQETKKKNLERHQEVKGDDIMQKIDLEINGLDNLARNYADISAKHLQSIEHAMGKRRCVDDLGIALINTKAKVTLAMRLEISRNIENGGLRACKKPQ